MFCFYGVFSFFFYIGFYCVFSPYGVGNSFRNHLLLVSKQLEDETWCSWIRASQYDSLKKNPTRCNNVSKFYYSIFIWSLTYFERHTAHHQEPKTALAAFGFSYVESCWTCSWWTLSGTLRLTTSTNYTSNNFPLMKNQCLTTSTNYASNNIPRMKNQCLITSTNYTSNNLPRMKNQSVKNVPPFWKSTII